MLNQELLQSYPAALLAAIVMVFIFVFFYVGHATRIYFIKKNVVKEDKTLGAVEASLLGLMALMLSFTFSMSSSRHDLRLNSIREEANDIGTAVLRADLYPDSIRRAFRSDFKKYVESRIAFYNTSRNAEEIKANLRGRDSLQARLWKRAATLGQDPANFHRTSQMVPALNAMFDIVTTRNVYLLAKVPNFIITMLFVLCFTCAFMLGYSIAQKPDWIIVTVFNLMISLCILMILDLDRPRRGFINLDVANEQIVELRNMFEPGE